MTELKLAYYVCIYVAILLTVAVFAAECWKYIKLTPFLFLKVKSWIQSLFSKKSATPLKQTNSQFTGILTTLDITTGSETAQPISAKPLYNRSAFGKVRKRDSKGRFIKN